MIFWILILGLILRLINLNQSLWLDEATQYLLSKNSLMSIILQRGADFHPPLSYIFMHFWLFFGSSEIWLRLLSVIFGVLTICLLYKFSKEVFNEKIATLASLLLSIAPYHIYYSQEIRMYSEATFFALLSMYFFYKINEHEKFINSLLYILFSTALIYIHYDGFFLILAQFIYLLFHKRALLISFTKKVFFIVILWLPWMTQFIIQLKAGSGIDQYLPGWKNILSLPSYKALALTFFKFSFGRISFDNFTSYILVATFVMSVFGFILFRGIKELIYKDSKLIIYWLCLPIIMSLLISFAIPLNQPFRLLYVLPAFYLILALGIYSLNKVRIIFFVLLILISFAGLSLYYFDSKYWREDWRSVSQFILNNSNENSLAIFAWPNPFPPYQYYAHDKFAAGVVNNFPATEKEVQKNLVIVDNKKEVYLFEYLSGLSDPNKTIQIILKNKGFKEDRIYNFRGVGFVFHYTK